MLKLNSENMYFGNIQSHEKLRCYNVIQYIFWKNDKQRNSN